MTRHSHPSYGVDLIARSSLGDGGSLLSTANEGVSRWYELTIFCHRAVGPAVDRPASTAADDVLKFNLERETGVSGPSTNQTVRFSYRLR